MSDNKCASRRGFLRYAAVAFGLLVFPLLNACQGAAPTPAAEPKAAAQSTAAPKPAAAPPAKLQPVTMRLDWLLNGPNAGFTIAREKGFYGQVGLDVTVGPGKGSGSTAQLIAQKADMIGFADGYVVGNSVAKGMDIRMVGAIFRRNPGAVVVMADSGIKQPKDLEGKTVGTPTGGTSFQQWPAYLKGCKLDGNKIQLVNTDPAGTPLALVQGKVDGIAGYAQGYVPTVEARSGKKATMLWYADCGVVAISNGIIVHNDLLKENPKLVQDFVAASVKGFLYAREHPDEAVSIIQKNADAIDPAITKREMELSWQTWVSENTKAKPLGWMSDKDWDGTVEVLKQYGGVTTPLEAKQLYNNEFVPTGQEFVPPQS